MRLLSKILVAFALLAAISVGAAAQTPKAKKQPAKKIGPNVQAYLDYLESELTVTDVPESQREVSAEYVRRNYNRVAALRQFAVKIAGESDVDYVPEMEAVVEREFNLLFSEDEPKPATLKVGETYAAYRYLGSVRSNREVFYIFARLDPFEEEEALKAKTSVSPAAAANQTQIETKAATLETKPENNKLTRERILSGDEQKSQNKEKQPNRLKR